MALILGRILLSLAALVVGSVLIFAATEALPGDPAQAVLGRAATPETVAALRRELGLDRPFAERYAEWISGAFRGDLGRSGISQQPVWDFIAPRLANTVLLASCAVLLTIPLSIVLGLLTGLRSGTWFDGTVSSISLILLSIPEFVFGVLLAAVFGIFWGILPPTSLFSPGESFFEHLEEAILPAIAVGGVVFGYILRMTRVATIEVLESDFVVAARLRGVGSASLLARHVLRNALLPVVNVIGSNIAWMFGGLVIIETVFAFPGIGSLLVQATSSQDASLLAAVALIITTAYIVIILLADIAVVVLNPRLRRRAQ